MLDLLRSGMVSIRVRKVEIHNDTRNSDSLAEFNLPRSGIEIVVEHMDFPSFSQQSEHGGLAFLAICSVRKLLNRIHHTIYATDQRVPIPAAAASPATNTTEYSTQSSGWALDQVAVELAHQLENWLSSIPKPLRPDMNNNQPTHLQQGWLRLRYWSAKHIIYRPFLILVASTNDPQQLPPFYMESSKNCIEACKNYIETAAFVLGHRTQYTWMTIQAYVSLFYVSFERPLT